MPPTNNLIMLGTLLQSFRHLEQQNPSIISDFIVGASMVQTFRRSWIREVVAPVLATREIVAPLTNNPIMSGEKYSSSDSLNIKILQNLRPVALQTAKIFFS